MSTASRFEIERRRDQAQRERANMAQIANEQKEGFPCTGNSRSLFEPPSKEGETQTVDKTTELIESIFGLWENVKWESGNPVLRKRTPTQPSPSGSTSSHQSRGEHRQPAQSSSSSLSDTSKDRYHSHTQSSQHRSTSEQRSEAANKNHSLHEQSRSSTSSSVPRSKSSHKHAMHSAQSRSSTQSSSQGSSSSHNKPSPLLPQHGSGTSLPKGSSPERERQHHVKDTWSMKHISDHQDTHLSSDRKSRADASHAASLRGPVTPVSSPPPSNLARWTPSPDQTPPPSSRTPPPRHRTPTASHRTPPPVRHTPPAPHRTPPPLATVLTHRTPPPSHPAATHNETRTHVDSKPTLTLNIKRENNSGVLEDIFKEMAVDTPLTALSETPVKCKKAPRFQFVPKQEIQVDEDLKVKPPLSPLPEPDNTYIKTEELPAVPIMSRISADLEVSDDSDIEVEDKSEDNKDEAPDTAHTAAVVKEASHSSSDESSSSDSSSASDSESSSSDSEDENEEENDNKEEASADKEKPSAAPVANTPDKKMNGSWGLSQFMNPASVLSSSQTSSDLPSSKSGSSQDVSKVSPRKIAEIGPCSSMPFIVHDDSDPIPRNCEKSSGSPDTLSTPSSHASSLDMGRGSQHKTGRESASDTAASSRFVPASKPDLTKVGERPETASGSNSRESEGASVIRPATDCADAAKASNQQYKHRRTSSSRGTSKASKTLSGTSSPSEGNSGITVQPVAKSVSGKQSCDSVEQQAVSDAGEPAGSQPLSCAISSKKTASKTKTPDRDSIQNMKAATKRKSSSRECGDDSSKSGSTKTASDTLTDIGSIIKDVSVPQLLSPTIPAYSGDVGKGAAVPKGLSVPTLTCGKPSIVVRLQPQFMSRSPRPIKSPHHKKNESVLAKKESGAAKLTGGSAAAVSTSESKGGENSQSESLKQSSVKSASAKTSGGSGVKKRISESVGLSQSPNKRKKVDAEDGGSSKKQKVPSHINNKPSPEINGVAHPEEVKKAGNKRVAERRSSVGSNGSHSSQKSGTKERDTSATKSASAPKKARKTEPDGPAEEKVTNSTEGKTSKEDLPFNCYKQPEISPKPAATPTPLPPSQSVDSNSEDPLAAALDRLEPQDFYMVKAKELKHMADKKHDKPSKLIPYIRSILYFIMWGHAHEKQTPSLAEPHHAFTIYMDTLSLHNYVNRLRINVLHDGSPTDRERKLSVLILRIQSILCLKLFSFRRSEVMKLKKIIDSEPSKNSTMKMSTHAPSPHQNHWNKNSTGTPSPMSPTPSPACSIGSVESQGSCEQPGNKMTNGALNNGAMSSPGTIAVSQRIHSVTQKYVTYTSNLIQCHECWEAASAEIRTYNLHDFFQSLDARYNTLSINSSLPHLVVYVNAALKELTPTTPS